MRKGPTPDFVLEQIWRLKTKPFYPLASLVGTRSVNHGERELVRTAVTYGENNDHVRRVIDVAVIRPFGPDGQDRCPSTSDLWALFREIDPVPPDAKAKANPDCEHCSGLGWVIVERHPGITGASRCPVGCPPRDGSPASALTTKAVMRIYEDAFARAERRRAEAQ